MILTGCGDKTPPQPVAAAAPAIAPPQPVAVTPPPPVPIPRMGPRQQTQLALDLLNKGDVVGARLQVMGVLAQRPADRVALDLLAQIDTDPRKLLGEKSYTYQIRSGETLSSIAARLLHNPRRFWALARYNDIAVPANAEVGQSIQVPGAPPAPVTVARPVTAPTVPAPQAATEQRKADPAAANRIRSAGLAEMTRGSIDKAVTLLQRALALNPADMAIQEDLTRARKIQQTLRQR